MKKLLAMTAAFVMALSMTACGATDDDDDDEPPAPKKTLAAEDDSGEEPEKTKATTAAPDTTTTTTTTTTAAATTTTTTTTTKATDPQPTEDGSVKTYYGTDYRFDVNLDDWSEETPSGTDFNFYSVDLGGTVNFNVSRTENGQEYSDDFASDLCERLKSTYLEFGYDSVDTDTGTYTAAYSTQYPCIQVKMHTTFAGASMTQEIYYLFQGTHSVVFTFTAGDEYFDSYVSNLYKVINTAYLQ